MKIMFLAHENECFANCELAKLFERDGHECWIVITDYWSFIDNQRVQDWCSERGFTKWIDFEAEYRKLYNTEFEVDWAYLKSFETRYCRTKNLQQLMMTDMILSRSHHHRSPYYTPIKSKKRLYYWVELQLRWCESLLENLDPDVIFTLGTNYFIKNVIWQIASTQNKVMYTLEDTRVLGSSYISDNFNLGTSATVLTEISKESPINSNLTAAEDYINYFRRSLFSTVVNTPAEEFLQGPWLNPKAIIFELISYIKKILRHQFLRKKKYRGRLQANYFNSDYRYLIPYYAHVAFNKLRFKWRNPCIADLPARPFIYLPLHVLPESSTLTLSTEYYEADLIRFIAKELPAGLLLVVKEHPMMVGERPFKFYADLAELPNVLLLDPRYSSKEAVLQSMGVTGISGTALFEAAMLQKPTHTFGTPEFLTVVDFVGYSEFGDFARYCAANLPSRKYDIVLKYVQYMLDHGVVIPWNDILIKPGSEAFNKGVGVIYQMLQSKLDMLPLGSEQLNEPVNHIESNIPYLQE